MAKYVNRFSHFVKTARGVDSLLSKRLSPQVKLTRIMDLIEKAQNVNLKLGGVRADRVANGEILKAQAIEILEYVVNNHATVKRFVNGLYILRWNELNPAKLAIQQANRRCLVKAMTPEEEDNYANLVEIRDNATALFGYSWDIDHVIPVAKGGTNAIDNLEVVPSTWNRAKRDRHSDSFWG